MNIHRSSRAKAKNSILRRWLGKAMQASQRPIESRPLLCERLERRYALHGMGWLAESSEGFEYAEVEYGEDANTDNRFAQVRTWQAAYQTSVRPVARYRDSYALGEASAFDASFGDMFDEPCDRPHGAKPEGEGPGSLSYHGLGGGGETTRFFLGIGSIYDQLSTKPQPKISDWTPPKFDSSKSDPVGLHDANTSSNTTASHIANDTALQVHVTVQTGAPTMGPTTTAPATPKLIDFTTGGRGLATPQSASVSPIGRNSFTPSTSVVNRADASPSLTNSSNQATTLASSNSQLSRPTTSTTAASTLANTDKDASATIGNSWQNDRPGTIAATKSERDTEGLLSELRAVIEKLANDQATGKAGPGSSARINGSLGSRATEELFSSNRQRMFDDGMLELAATNHPLSTVVASVDVAGQLTGEAHRSQLIASLELNREFDLAGQSVQSFKSVIDPTTRVHDASLAAEEIGNWNDQFSASAGLSAKPVEAESTLWQRSILPLSFLAIGSLLIRSRRKYRASKSTQ